MPLSALWTTRQPNDDGAKRALAASPASAGYCRYEIGVPVPVPAWNRRFRAPAAFYGATRKAMPVALRAGRRPQPSNRPAGLDFARNMPVAPIAAAFSRSSGNATASVGMGEFTLGAQATTETRLSITGLPWM